MRSKDIHTVGLFDAPLIKANPVGDPDGLRYYQRACNTAVFESFKTNRSCLVVLATGLGKTQIFCSVARAWRGRVLVLCHREELIDQARKRLELMCRERVEVEQGQVKSGRARIVVGSVQTVYRPDRLEALARKGGFSLIIVDEAHHYISDTYRKPLEFFSDAKILGVTATPDRGDGRALAAVFDDVAFTMDVRDGVRAGYLVPPRGREVFIEEINLDLVSANRGDLAIGELDEALIKGVEGVVHGMLKYTAEKQGILFLPGVKSSVLAAARLNALKPGCARSIDGNTPPAERNKNTEDFRNGKFQLLCNCMIATEGFDAPAVAVVGMARMTTSRGLCAQCVGRGLRPLPGVVDGIEGEDRAQDRRAAILASPKPGCLIVDFTGKNSKHRLMTPADVLGGHWDEPSRKKARELQEMPENEEKSTEELLDEAQRLTNAEIERVALSVRSSVKARSRDFDPFASVGVDLETENKYAIEYGYKAPTERQLETLKKFGFDVADMKSLSRRAATKVLGQSFARKELGLASPKQLSQLHKYGVKDSNITSVAATKALDYIKANEYGKGAKYDTYQLHEILFGGESNG